MRRLLLGLVLSAWVCSASSAASTLGDLRQRAEHGDQVAIEQMVWGYVERLDYLQAGVWARRLDGETARRTYLKSWVMAQAGDAPRAKEFLASCDSESCKALYSSLLLESAQLLDLDEFTREWWASKFSAQAFAWYAYTLLARNELIRFDSLMLEAERVGASQPVLIDYIASIRNLRPKIR